MPHEPEEAQPPAREPFTVVVEPEPAPPERPVAPAPPRPEPAEPTVHIGVVEVVVTEPSTQTPAARPSRHNPNAASRRYLRVF